MSNKWLLASVVIAVALLVLFMILLLNNFSIAHKPELVTEVEGAKLYKVYDSGRYRYFVVQKSAANTAE